jgi:lipopolysaccharide cholinephosphotransferase
MKTDGLNSDVRVIQNEAFEILCFLDRICRARNLRYYLAYGTLLGAVRHRGFIPWDDDVDVWMPRDDYMKLLDYLRKEDRDERFALSDGIYREKGDRPPELQMRIIDKTMRISRVFSGRRAVMYPWIDIFCLDVFPDRKKKQYLKTFQRRLFLYKIARCKSHLIEQDSFYGKMNKLIYTLHNRYHLFRHVLNEEKGKNKAVAAITKYQDLDERESREYFCYAAVYLPTPQKCFFDRTWFENTTELEFEGRRFFAPCGWDSVLKTLYRDYMQLPPEDQRHCTHGAELIRADEADEMMSTKDVIS